MPMSDQTAPLDPAAAAPSRRLIPYYAGALCLAALAVALASSTEQIEGDPVLFVLLLLSVVALDSIRIDLFERSRISPASVPVLTLAALFGPLGPIAAELLIAGTRAVRRAPPVGFAFDFGSLALAGAAAAGTFHALHPTGGDAIAAGALAGLVYYAVNTPLLAVVIGLSQGTRPLDNWREQLAWLLPHYPAFGALAGLFVLAEGNLGLTALLIFGIPTVLLWVTEKQYLDRSRAGVAELRRSHQELERTNAQLVSALANNDALLRRIQRSYLSTITSLARTIEAKDPYTGGHTERVAQVARALALELGFRDDDLRAVEVGAVIHDIGKIGIRDRTLLKPGPLSEEERAEMQRHPEISSYILAELDLPPIVNQMCRNHHERYDGSGYPDGLSGEDIPLAARILTVADALDAMTSDRPYRAALPSELALAEIEGMAATQFCPRVTAALRSCLTRNPSLLADVDGEPARERVPAAARQP